MENPLFEQACRRAVSLEMGGVDHQGAIKENFVENTKPAPSDKAIAQRFVRAVLIRCILSLKSVLDDVDNAADDTPVIHTGAPWERGKNGLIRSN